VPLQPSHRAISQLGRAPLARLRLLLSFRLVDARLQHLKLLGRRRRAVPRLFEFVA